MEEDPAADFLAREQDELAGIVDDTLGYTPNVNAEPAAPQEPEPDFFGGGGGGVGGEPEPLATTEEPAAYDPYSAVTQMDTIQAEPECIKQWREQQAEMLAKKDQEEEEALKEMQNQATVELQEWYTRHEEQLTQIKAGNRQAEAAFIEERDEDVPGHEWERVARICDFNPKNSKNTKDVSRMRSIFLQLKQTPLVRS